MENTEKQQLCHLVNDGRFKEAFLFFQNLHQDRPGEFILRVDSAISEACCIIRNPFSESIRKLAIDAIFDAVTKFRDNNDDDLRALVLLLFDAIHPELLKFRICFNFITARSSPHLNEILVYQLGSIVKGDFRERHPAEWQEFRDVLPVKLAENLASGEDVDQYLAIQTASILFFFNEIPFVIPERMSEVFARAVHIAEPELPAAFPLLALFSRSHPFSPKLLDIVSPTMLIPSVYRQDFLARRLAEGLTTYLEQNEYNYEKHFVKPIVTSLNAIVDNMKELNTKDIDLFCKLLLRLLRFAEDFDQRSFRVPIMNKCQEIIHSFPSQQRCLLIKHILPQILDNDDLELDNESNIVAWFVDLYRRYLNEEQFCKELGSFLGLVEDVRYNDMLLATNYYSSIFCLVQTIAMKRLNPAMLPEVETRLVGRIYAQLKDYIQLEEMRKKEKDQKKEAAPKMPKDIQFEIATHVPDGSVVEQLQLLMFGCEQAKKYITEAINCAK